jgi:hypothetical protein
LNLSGGDPLPIPLILPRALSVSLSPPPSHRLQPRAGVLRTVLFFLLQRTTRRPSGEAQPRRLPTVPLVPLAASRAAARLRAALSLSARFRARPARGVRRHTDATEVDETAGGGADGRDGAQGK